MSNDKSTGKTKGFILITVICFIVFSLGFLPLIIVSKIFLFFIPMNQLWHLFLLPFFIYFVLVTIIFYQLLFSGLAILLFKLRYEPGIYDYTYNNKMAFRWIVVCALYTPIRKIHEIFLRYSPEKLPLAAQPQDVINISELDLDPRLYPMEDFRRCVQHVLLSSGADSLLYGDHRGYLPLRQHIAKRLRLHGISVSEKEILITNGAQQALDLIVRMLAKGGKKVAIESPTYAAVLPLLKFNGVRLLEIPMRKNGMDLDSLEKALAEEKLSFVYTIPNFQNPTGITTSHQHRERLLNICQKHRVPIVEDGFEEDMKYFGRVALPIKSIDEKNIVIYLGTFSKALFPGLRIGWVTADKECVSRLTAIKRFSDLGTGKLVQAVLAEFLKRGYYDKQLKRMHRVFRKRLQVALKAMAAVLPRTVSWTHPTGGYTIWVRLPKKWDESKLHSHLARYGVIVSPGSYYFPDRKSCEYFRLSIAKRNEQEITEAVTRLGKALHNL